MNYEEYNFAKFLLEFPSVKQYIECYLVKNNVRPAYLLEGCICLGRQNNNWLSRIFSFDNGCKIHSSIRKWFPSLIETQYPGFGTFISTNKINTSAIRNDDDIGRILGYPACEGFTNLNRDEIYYSFKIQITFKNIPECVKQSFIPIEIISNVSAIDITEEMELIRKKIEYVLKTKPAETLYIIIKDYIDTITLIKNICYPVKYLITKLVNNQILLEEEKAEIHNYIWNTEDEALAEYNFEWQNQIHIGILITLLSRHENDVLQPFYYHFREESINSKECEKIQKKFSNELITFLDASRIK